LLLAAAASPAAAQPEFRGLGTHPDFRVLEARGLSADGRIVVGTGLSTAPGPFRDRAFFWTPASGIAVLPSKDPTFPHTQAHNVSPGGNLILGQNANEAYGWTGAGALGQSFGIYGTPPFPAGFSYGASAHAASADGSVVVGNSTSHLGHHAFRWTPQTGMTSLGFLPGTTGAGAEDTSADGSVVVGSASAGATSPERAFRWTPATGMHDLSLSPTQPSRATAISADGSTVVGWAGPQNQTRAFRWTHATGPVDLGTFGDWSQARDVSADARVIVGAAENGAFIWDPAHGIRPLKSVLTVAGLDLTGWHLGGATAITPDGSTITGYGLNPAGQPESWIARNVPEPSSLALLLLECACLTRRTLTARRVRS
jgi:probable HAF family extracellular repeat protein